MTPHARRRSLRIPGWYIGLALMLVSAALTLAVLWWALALLLSFQSYIPSEVFP